MLRAARPGPTANGARGRFDPGRSTGPTQRLVPRSVPGAHRAGGLLEEVPVVLGCGEIRDGVKPNSGSGSFSELNTPCSSVISMAGHGHEEAIAPLGVAGQPGACLFSRELSQRADVQLIVFRMVCDQFEQGSHRCRITGTCPFPQPLRLFGRRFRRLGVCSKSNLSTARSNSVAPTSERAEKIAAACANTRFPSCSCPLSIACAPLRAQPDTTRTYVSVSYSTGAADRRRPPHHALHSTWKDSQLRPVDQETEVVRLCRCRGPTGLSGGGADPTPVAAGGHSAPPAGRGCQGPAGTPAASYMPWRSPTNATPAYSLTGPRRPVTSPEDV